MFLAHVIGGKHLSERADFTAWVRGATPDVVLTGVELLARGLDEEHPGAGDVVVIDVGGATKDVHSVTGVDPEEGSRDESWLAREVVAPVNEAALGEALAAAVRQGFDLVSELPLRAHLFVLGAR